MIIKASVLSAAVVSGLLIISLIAGCEKAKESARTQSSAKNVTVAEFTFEDGIQKWRNRKNTDLEQDRSIQHSGQASLKVWGTAVKDDWHFAVSPHFSITPGKKYKFTGWMLVNSLSSSESDPWVRLKIGIYKDKKNIGSKSTAKYILAKKGEWQLLTTSFEAPSVDNLSVNFTIDKKKYNNIEAIIFVDDISLQQIN